ncbi:hypothetical protein HDV04_000923 [Boothiomyces sp. JEL0838]|nr:hypothetical protein HDV04_000923 [Boothiomyces sp. JEL0838]
MNLFRKTKILCAGHPMLRSKAQPVDLTKLKSKEFQDIVTKMKQAISKSGVIGMAAPQVGHSVRLIAVNLTDNLLLKEKRVEKLMPTTFFVNPQLKVLKQEYQKEYEFCESIPSYSGIVSRATRVYLTAFDLDGNKVEGQYTGFMARVLQHEVDHLEGIVFVDKMEPTSLRHDKYVGEFEMHMK